MNGVIREFLTEKEVRNVLEIRRHLGAAVEQVGRMIRKTVQEWKMTVL